MLNSLAWRTEKKCMRRYKGKCDIFFGTEHRLRKEEMEEQFNREANEGWRRWIFLTQSGLSRKPSRTCPFVVVPVLTELATNFLKERLT